MNTDDYLRNLDKWQACSHPGLANRKPEELFEPGFVDRYHRLHENLLWRIVRVHGTLYTLAQLEQFPFEYIYGPNEMEFWRLTAENFFDIACLMLHGLVGDTGKDVHSIPSFRKNVIRGPWLCQEKLALLQQTLLERKFDKVVVCIRERVKTIRNHCVAHQLIAKQSGSPKEALASVSFEELRELFKAAHSLFGALSFGAAYATLAGDLMPATVGGQPTRTCLDEVLDAVLRDSHFVNQPEHDGVYWEGIRKQMDPEHLRVMNDLRSRIRLPEA